MSQARHLQTPLQPFTYMHDENDSGSRVHARSALSLGRHARSVSETPPGRGFQPPPPPGPPPPESIALAQQLQGITSSGRTGGYHRPGRANRRSYGGSTRSHSNFSPQGNRNYLTHPPMRPHAYSHGYPPPLPAPGYHRTPHAELAGLAPI